MADYHVSVGTLMQDNMQKGGDQYQRSACTECLPTRALLTAREQHKQLPSILGACMANHGPSLSTLASRDQRLAMTAEKLNIL